ncbi:uncharacterized protein LOC123943488 isoform X2 [Meles meles]|uniref:uncharacterized protein LOC123943487 isoform X2 n=1 Tax=Meles meles TaxID=9662 RepID=UPI001E699280|nr:uncharacterized protein LOC123943487 isoform X2 [Meles meles]XP_045863747.1 uncharacterized protein LOC123943488 isoform X2 [Meles meles]
MPLEGSGGRAPSPLSPRQPCEQRVVAALGTRSPRGHVPETWMQGSSWHVPLFLCPTAWRRGLGARVSPEPPERPSAHVGEATMRGPPSERSCEASCGRLERETPGTPTLGPACRGPAVAVQGGRVEVASVS